MERSGLFEHTAVAMAIVDAARQIRSANGAFEALVPPKAARVDDALHPDDRAAALDAFAAADGGGGATFEARVASSPGRWFAFRVDRVGEEELGLVAWDVTDAHAQRARARVLSRLLEGTPIALTAADAQGAITIAEGRGLEVLGLAPGDVLGLDVRELYRDTGLEEAIEAAYRGSDASARCVFASGSTFDHWLTPVLDEAGAVAGIIGIGVDTTAQTAAERELAARREEIRAKDDTLRAMATPILRVRDGILCMPIIGDVDRDRATTMTHALLEAVCRERARHVVLDLTGVDRIDTSSAHALLHLVAAAKLVGATAVISGLRPAVAAAIAGLGVAMHDVPSTLHLGDALRLCEGRMRDDAASRTSRANGPRRAPRAF